MTADEIRSWRQQLTAVPASKRQTTTIPNATLAALLDAAEEAASLRAELASFKATHEKCVEEHDEWHLAQDEEWAKQVEELRAERDRSRVECYDAETLNASLRAQLAEGGHNPGCDEALREVHKREDELIAQLAESQAAVEVLTKAMLHEADLLEQFQTTAGYGRRYRAAIRSLPASSKAYAERVALLEAVVEAARKIVNSDASKIGQHPLGPAWGVGVRDQWTIDCAILRPALAALPPEKK